MSSRGTVGRSSLSPPHTLSRPNVPWGTHRSHYRRCGPVSIPHPWSSGILQWCTGTHTDPGEPGSGSWSPYLLVFPNPVKCGTLLRVSRKTGVLGEWEPQTIVRRVVSRRSVGDFSLFQPSTTVRPDRDSGV